MRKKHSKKSRRERREIVCMCVCLKCAEEDLTFSHTLLLLAKQKTEIRLCIGRVGVEQSILHTCAKGDKTKF